MEGTLWWVKKGNRGAGKSVLPSRSGRSTFDRSEYLLSLWEGLGLGPFITRQCGRWHTLALLDLRDLVPMGERGTNQIMTHSKSIITDGEETACPGLWPDLAGLSPKKDPCGCDLGMQTWRTNRSEAVGGGGRSRTFQARGKALQCLGSHRTESLLGLLNDNKDLSV